MITRFTHPRTVWVIEHLLTLYIALAVTALVGLAIWEAMVR